MAESVISFSVERLGDLLIQEAVFLHGVQELVKELQIELKRMQCFLKDADASAYQGNERVRNLVAEIKDVAYDSEDVVDTFILRTASRMKGGLYGVLKRYTCIFNEWIDLHKTGTEIEAIQKRIHSITNSLQTYLIQSIGEGEGSSSATQRQRQIRWTYPNVEEEDVISLEKDIEALVAQLIRTEDRRRVVSIVGMGGLGKTTLAAKLYNHNLVKHYFDCSAWAFISQQCQRKDVLQTILKGVSEMGITERMKEEELVEKLQQVLKEKRYLVVLDDIWSTEAWDLLKSAFPLGKDGSKIMITTRNKEVPLHADPFILPHEHRLLTDEESWVLLCKKAFLKDDVSRVGFLAAGMEQLGREMVKKCGGLPLAVVVLGGLLATKKSPYEWEMVYKNFNMHLSKSRQQQQEWILALSYHDLSYYLKPCFLYLGLFPEDFEISTTQLIRRWVAEGFVTLPQEGEGEGTMEDVAEKCLEELIFRCMVQVGRRYTNERVKTCRIHDLMRDLCIKEAKEDRFLEILHNGGNMDVADSSSGAVAKARRCAIHFGLGQERYVPWEQRSPHLRSILFFVRVDRMSLRDEQLMSICKKFKLLRVLDLGGANLINIPREIGSLIQLRFLALRYTNPYQFLPSLGNLQGLQTLHLKKYFFNYNERHDYKVTGEISKMKQLRHLYLTPDVGNRHLRVDTLSNLQTLSDIWAGGWIEKDLSKLTNIRKLKIWFTERKQVETLLESLVPRLKSLSCLSLKFALVSNETFPDLKPLCRCHLLSKVHLLGRIGNLVPENHPFPLNLTKLRLGYSELEQDPMATLENLPRLKILNLYRSFTGKEMVCSTKGFPQLELLRLGYLNELEEWRVEEGAMPSLGRLEIYNCTNLRMVPEGLRFVTTLSELKIILMPQNFKERLQVLDGRGGEDFYKVKHIPSITFVS